MSDRKSEGAGSSLYDPGELKAYVNERGANGGRLIDWKFWAGTLTSWTQAEAVRLMAGLDPEKFPELVQEDDSEPMARGPYSTRNMRALARKMQRVASDPHPYKRMDSGSPAQWLAWADRNVPGEVHQRFRLMVMELAPVPSADAESESHDAPRITSEKPKALPWWQRAPYDILKLAQKYGADAVKEGKSPTSTEVSRRIATHIQAQENANARSRMNPRNPPTPETIRTKALNGWRYSG